MFRAYHAVMKKQPMRHEVSCEFDGKLYSSGYVIEGGLVTVTDVLYGTKSAVPGARPDVIAQLLLHELLTDAKRQGRLR